MTSVTPALPSFEAASTVTREEQREAIINQICSVGSGLTSYGISARSAPSKAPLGKKRRHMCGNQTFGTSKTFCHLIRPTRTHGDDDYSFSNHFTPKWTDQVKCSQPIFLIGREGKLRAGANSEE